MAFDPSPGTECVYEHRVVQIDGPLSSSRVAIRDMATGELLEASVGQLSPLRKRVEETKSDPRFVPREQWEKVAKLAQDLTPLMEAGGGLTLDEARRLAQVHGVSARTIRRRLRRYRQDPRASALRPKPTGRRQGARLCSDAVETLVSDAIQEHYLRREAPSLAYLMEQIKTACRLRGLSVPSRSTVTRRVDGITLFERMRRRRGTRAAKQALQPRPGCLAPTRPLEIVQMDHALCDEILVSDDEHRLPVGRPWLTVAIDVFTRCIVGIHLSYEAPSATSVALCLENMLLPKDAWLAKLNLAASWPMYGKPMVLLLDNGKDFHSEALRRGCEEFGIELRYRPVKEPHFGAHIERLIGTLMKRVHLLPGTTFSNPIQRGDYPSAERAIMTLTEFRAWLIDQICRWYHVKRHRGIGQRAPIQLWETAWMQGDKPSVPPIVGPALEVRAAFLPVDWRPVHRTGIELHCEHYWHDALEPLIGAEEKTCVRYDPRDIRQILLRLPDGKLLEVPSSRPIDGPVSLWERRLARKQMRQLGNDPALLAQFDQGILNHNAAVATASAKTREARRRQKTAEQRHADSPIPVTAAPIPNPTPAEEAYSGPRSAPTVEVWS